MHLLEFIYHPTSTIIIKQINKYKPNQHIPKNKHYDHESHHHFSSRSCPPPYLCNRNQTEKKPAAQRTQIRAKLLLPNFHHLLPFSWRLLSNWKRLLPNFHHLLPNRKCLLSNRLFLFLSLLPNRNWILPNWNHLLHPNSKLLYLLLSIKNKIWDWKFVSRFLIMYFIIESRMFSLLYWEFS